MVSVRALRVHLAVLLLASSSAAQEGEPALANEISRAALVKVAIARSPAIRAGKLQSAALALDAKAERKWPAPQAMVQLWQVPLAKPYALGDAGMLMVGLSQDIPPPGSRGARGEAAAEQSAAAEAMASDSARLVTRAAEHAFAEWVEATMSHGVHASHTGIAERAVAVARAKQQAGGPLTDLAQAEAEHARARAELTGDAVRVQAARTSINALLGRAPDAPLGAPRATEPELPEWPLEKLLETARESRPDVKAAEAERRAREASRRGADSEASWPSFNAALLYFAPVGQNEHGYGVNFAMSLPWLWGPTSAKSDAAGKAVDAAGASVDAARRQSEIEIAQTYGAARVAARKVLILRDAAIPAGRRALEAAQTGYESGRSELLAWLAAERNLVDVEMELVRARAALEHALAELDAAAGVEVPRKPVAALEEGGRDGH